MSDTKSTICPACGARLAPDADACDLCGTPVDATELRQVEEAGRRARGDAPSATHEGDASEGDASEDDASPGEAVYCNACGWENPSGARFCSQCGEQLQAEAAARPVAADLPRGNEAAEDGERATSPEADANSSMPTRQVGLIVGVALLVVVGLFVATTWSQRIDWGTSNESETAEMPSEGAAGGPATPAAPGGAMPGAGAPGEATTSEPADLETLVQEHATEEVPASLQDKVTTLEEQVEQRSGEEQRAAQQELVNLYVGAGAMGRAALVQQRIAEGTDTPEDWRRAGDLLYSWMEAMQGEEPSAAVAEHVVAAYQAILDQEPENLDVRTDMATAYLQTNNPMRGVEEINRVLEEDPDHFQARFNKGIMLTMIGRAEDAIDEFEYVKQIVGSDSPYYEQADRAIQTIRARMQQQ